MLICRVCSMCHCVIARCAAQFYIELGGRSDGSHRNKEKACDVRGIVIQHLLRVNN